MAQARPARLSPRKQPVLASHRRLTPLGLLTGLLLLGTPARALEMIRIQLPLLQTDFTVKVSELSSPQHLLQGHSDLAQLDRAVDGRIGQRMAELINTPLPVDLRNLVNQSQDNPLVEQIQLVASTLVQVEGVPGDDDSRLLAAALARIPAGRFTASVAAEPGFVSPV